MLDGFLPLRYLGLTRPDKVDKYFAYKCRKYSAWNDIHNQNGDRNALKDFAEEFLTHGEVNVAAFGQIIRIFLNAKIWGLRKKGRAPVPEPTPQWESTDTLLTVASENPEVMVISLCNEGIDLQGGPIGEGPNTDMILTVFLIKTLDNFFSNSCIPGYVGLNITNLRLAPDIIKTFLDNADRVYQYFGYKTLTTQSDPYARYEIEDDFSEFELDESETDDWNDMHIRPEVYRNETTHEPVSSTEIQDVVQRICSDLGFDVVPCLPPDYRFNPDVNQEVDELVVVFDNAMGGRLFRTTTLLGRTIIKLNSDHPFLKSTTSCDLSRVAIEKFFKALVLSQHRMPAQDAIFETYFEYLDLTLNAQFRDAD